MSAQECDADAAKLVTQYAREGEFAIVIRTMPNGTVRMIYIRTDVERVAAILETAADTIFEGKYRVAVRGDG